MATTLNGNSIPLKLSIDAGTTYKSVVCAATTDVNFDRTINKREVKCGLLSTVGNLEWSVDISGVVNTSPAGTEISFEELLSIIVNNTDTLAKIESPVAGGTDFYIQGTVIMTNLKLGTPSGDFVDFSATLTGSGTVDITP